MITSHKLHTQGVWMIVVMTLVWGTTFPVIKIMTNSLSPAILITSRFGLAALVFMPWLRFKNSSSLWIAGFQLGILLFVSFITQVIGLTTISSTRSAFITGFNVILIPIFARLLGRSIPRVAYFAAGLALVGMGAMSFEAGAFGLGDLWMLGCAVAYAAYVLMLERVAPKHDPLQLTAVQLMVVALLSFAWSTPEFIQQPPTLNTSGWLLVAYLGFIATAAATLVQAVAQRWVPAFEVAVLYALEPVFAAIFSFFLLNERLGWRAWIGAGFVLSAMILSQQYSQKELQMKRN